MERLIALILLASCASAGNEARIHTGRFFVEVIGQTALISTSQRRSNEPCILGSADQPVLEQLAHAGYATEVEITYELLPRPTFTALNENEIPNDRVASVRGRIIAPWCDSLDFYWIRSVRSMPSPR